MTSNDQGLVRRFLSRVADLLPDGGIGNEGPAPDIDGKRDTDAPYRRAVLKVKSQMSPGGQATTSYEPVDPPCGQMPSARRTWEKASSRRCSRGRRNPVWSLRMC